MPLTRRRRLRLAAFEMLAVYAAWDMAHTVWDFLAYAHRNRRELTRDRAELAGLEDGEPCGRCGSAGAGELRSGTYRARLCDPCRAELGLTRPGRLADYRAGDREHPG